MGSVLNPESFTCFWLQQKYMILGILILLDWTSPDLNDQKDIFLLIKLKLHTQISCSLYQPLLHLHSSVGLGAVHYSFVAVNDPPENTLIGSNQVLG